MASVDETSSSPSLNEVAPTEVVGRDTISRYQAQYRAAAYCCLAILHGKGVNRVYCDYHDDFVCRYSDNGKPIYHFYQVKTKSQRNYRWDKGDVFGLLKRGKPKVEKVAGSFAGKLMSHTVQFNQSCGRVVFLTNVHLDDDLEAVVVALEASDFSNEILAAVADNFNAAFVNGAPLSPEAVKEKVGRLLLESGVGHLDPQDSTFGALAREAIFQYSEIDLNHGESAEIIQSLLALVQKKSSTKVIADMTEADFDDVVGVGIADLLEILSISKGAYRELIAGGDPKAIKNASIIQRKLKQADAGDEVIETCSRFKVEWDIWFRDKRHSLPEFDLNFLLSQLDNLRARWTKGDLKFADLEPEIVKLWEALKAKGLAQTLSKELLVGGVFAALVRSESV